MNKRILSLALALVLVTGAAFGATSMEEGQKAWDAGDQATARSFFLKAAEEGDARAMTYLGYMSSEGLGGAPKSIDDAKAWYAKGIAKQNGDSAYNLALLLADEGDVEGSLDALRKAQSWGHERAASDLHQKLSAAGKTDEAKQVFNYAFNRGQTWAVTNRALELLSGTAEEKIKARKLLQPMAEKGDMMAEYLLGSLEREMGNATAALAHLRKASAAGYAPAMHLLGLTLLASQPAEAMEWLTKASDAGFGPATITLGNLYEQGGSGVAAKPEDAVKLYQRGADKGDPLSQVSLGRLYETGTGVKRDPAKAAKLYAQAAQNLPQGKYHLSRLYYLGLGVGQDKAKALALLTEAANAGDGTSLHNLGLYTYLGQRGAKKDEEKGLALLEKAASLGVSAAAVDLARILLNQEKRDLPRITALLKDAAASGDPAAQVLMGRLTEESNDEGAIESARAWYQKAAASGDAEAEYVYATFLMEYDEKANPRQIVSLLSKAAAKDHALANFTLGRLFEQGLYVHADRARALHFYTKAANLGDAGAQTQLASLVLVGDDHTMPDPSTAAKWYQKAANQDYPVALTSLARLYATGVGVTRNLKTAASLYERAANLGNPQGQYNLGRMMLVGLGMWKNQKGGLEWIRKAADQGFGPAQNQLGVLYSQGAEGLTQSPYEALSWFLGAANQGYLTAQYNLGLLYASGQLGDTYAQAREWLCLAASQNHAGAARALALLYEQGKGGEVDKPTALWWAQKAQEWGYPDASADITRLSSTVSEKDRLTTPPPCDITLPSTLIAQPQALEEPFDEEE